MKTAAPSCSVLLLLSMFIMSVPAIQNKILSICRRSLCCPLNSILDPTGNTFHFHINFLASIRSNLAPHTENIFSCTQGQQNPEQAFSLSSACELCFYFSRTGDLCDVEEKSKDGKNCGSHLIQHCVEGYCISAALFQTSQSVHLKLSRNLAFKIFQISDLI